jgi:hypothetical protein
VVLAEKGITIDSLLGSSGANLSWFNNSHAKYFHSTAN